MRDIYFDLTFEPLREFITQDTLPPANQYGQIPWGDNYLIHLNEDNHDHVTVYIKDDEYIAGRPMAKVYFAKKGQVHCDIVANEYPNCLGWGHFEIDSDAYLGHYMQGLKTRIKAIKILCEFLLQAPLKYS